MSRTAPESTLMFGEALAAADAVERQLRANRERIESVAAQLRTCPPSAVITCARGSSDHAATYAKYLIETRLGVIVSSASPSVSSVYGVEQRLDDALCIAISQSGQSPDLLATIEAAKSAGARTLAIVNDEASPLAEQAGQMLPLCAGEERSVAATKSYIASLAAITHLVAAWSGDMTLVRALDSLPALLRSSWAADWSPLVERLRNARGLFVIGRGLGLGIAQEAALKLKETCALHAEALSAAEVRHGPMALVGPGFPLLVFRQADEAAASIEELAAEAVARGADVLVAGGGVKGALALPAVGAEPTIEPILQIQSFYRAANALSLARGLDPDRPPNLRKVTETV